MQPFSDNDPVTGRLLAIGFSRQVLHLVFHRLVRQPVLLDKCFSQTGHGLGGTCSNARRVPLSKAAGQLGEET